MTTKTRSNRAARQDSRAIARIGGHVVVMDGEIVFSAIDSDCHETLSSAQSMAVHFANQNPDSDVSIHQASALVTVGIEL